MNDERAQGSCNDHYPLALSIEDAEEVDWVLPVRRLFGELEEAVGFRDENLDKDLKEDFEKGSRGT